MSASWSSDPELSRGGLGAWASAGVLALLLGVWGCGQGQPARNSAAPVVNESPYPYPLCLEPLLSAESRAGCLIESYLETDTDMALGWKMRACARSTYALAEQYFAEGRFRHAWDLFGNSNACIPSYKATVREGDAAFAEGSECSLFYPEGIEIAVIQTYETALLFYPFELEQTGERIPEQELRRTRRKADCLMQLARRYTYQPESCIPLSLIRQCLEEPG
jgi:hypothetical protein